MLGALLAVCAGCASAPSRPAISTLGCAEAIVRELPSGLADKARHCVAAGLIARHCSRPEAWLVAAGKELGDIFGAGDAEWADWQADRTGMRCGRANEDDGGIMACCERAVRDWQPGQGSDQNPGH